MSLLSKLGTQWRELVAVLSVNRGFGFCQLWLGICKLWLGKAKGPPESPVLPLPQDFPQVQEGEYGAYWNRKFKLPWREAGLPNHPGDKVNSDQ